MRVPRASAVQSTSRGAPLPARAPTRLCQSCVAGSGQCVSVKSADDPSSCTGANTCDVAGACKKKNGRPCTEGSAECASGSCADDLCCDRACGGDCEACDGANPGTCAIVAGKLHGKRSCKRGKSDKTLCAGACNGTDADCEFPLITTGCGTSCGDAFLTARACDGDGACKEQTPRPCAGNFACADERSAERRVRATRSAQRDMRALTASALPRRIATSTRSSASMGRRGRTAPRMRVTPRPIAAVRRAKTSINAPNRRTRRRRAPPSFATSSGSAWRLRKLRRDAR